MPIIYDEAARSISYLSRWEIATAFVYAHRENATLQLQKYCRAARAYEHVRIREKIKIALLHGRNVQTRVKISYERRWEDHLFSRNTFTFSLYRRFSSLEMIRLILIEKQAREV